MYPLIMIEHDGSPAAAASPPLTGPVKWFDRDRGYGFILVHQPERDAFLHATVLRRSGFDMPAQGDRITCRVGTGARGLSVSEVIAIHHGQTDDDPSRQGTVQIVGRVKFFDLKRGYGFVRDEAGAEVFVGAKLLKRLGLAPLRPEQIVRVTAIPGERGLVAETLTFGC